MMFATRPFCERRLRQRWEYGVVISIDCARTLRKAGLRWAPTSGDRFVIDSDELVGEVFTVSDMTIEAHVFDTGTILGFNGTTEWALDSVALESALWLPREEQLREMLGERFRSLTKVGQVWRIEIVASGGLAHFDTAQDAAECYGLAVLEMLRTGRQ